MDYRVVCPSCHKQGTVQSDKPILEGARLRCTGCGHTYSYQEIYALEPEPAVSEVNPLPRRVLRERSADSRAVLIGHCVRLPGWAAIATGALQFISLVLGTILGATGTYSPTLAKYQEEDTALSHQQQAAWQEQTDVAN